MHRFEVLLFLAALSFFAGCKNDSKTPKTTARVETLELVHTPEVTPLVGDLVREFLRTSPVLPDGEKVEIQTKILPALEGALDIAKGREKTNLWLAPSRMVVNLANESLANLGPKQVDCMPIFSTPVIAAGRADGRRESGESDSIEWQEAHGDSPFLFAHAEPHRSAAGLAALAQLSTLADIPDSEDEFDSALQKLEAIHRYALRYGPADDLLLSQLASPAKVPNHVVITTEQQFALFERNQPELRGRLVPRFFKEGVVVQDYLLCDSDAAWFTTSRRAAAELFRRFLNSETAARMRIEHGFRHPLGGPGEEHSIAVLPVSVVPPLSGAWLERMVAGWENFKRPASVVFVIDRSGSMTELRTTVAQNIFQALIEALPGDSLRALVSFDTRARIEHDLGRESEPLLAHLNKTNGAGGSAFYDALRTAIDLLTLRNVAPSDHRHLVIAIVDGKDKNSQITLDLLTEAITTRAEKARLTVVIAGVQNDETDFKEMRSALEQAGVAFEVFNIPDPAMTDFLKAWL